jgi:hypothetical protein
MPQPQVGNWKPFKSGGGKPPDPPPVGRGPVAGYPSGRFPTVGPTDIAPPSGGYQSIVSTKAPFDAGQANRIANVKTPTASYGKGAAAQSSNAFNRGIADTSRNTIQNAANTFSTDYQKQAEKSRSEDILAQRQNAADRFRMDLFKNMFDVDTNVRYTEGIKDLNQYRETEKRNEEAKRTAMVLRMIGGLL